MLGYGSAGIGAVAGAKTGIDLLLPKAKGKHLAAGALVGAATISPLMYMIGNKYSKKDLRKVRKEVLEGNDKHLDRIKVAEGEMTKEEYKDKYGK